MDKVISILFALFCFATATLSNSIMGAGMWFWVILLTGLFVAVSAYMPNLIIVGAFLAGLLTGVSICAVLLGLVAATIGGSFRLDGPEAMLLTLFFCIAICGTIIAIRYKNKSNRIEP
jgi:cbb3-type cytochrome oxidase subunit 3